MAPDPSLRRTFRKTVEGRLAVVVANNPTVIVSSELSASLDTVSLVCHEDTFSARVVNHLGESLVRLLGVGRRLLIVDRGMTTVTIHCVPAGGGPALFSGTYSLD